MKLHLYTAIAVLPVFALTACQTANPYTGALQTSKATSGAIIGGILGAAVGSLTGSGSTDRRQKAMIGAGIGALSGGLVGNYMDRQEAELRAQLRGTGVSVTRNGDSVILNMPGDVTFASGSANVSSASSRTLDSVAIVLAKYKRTLVNVTGHTDSVGARSYNYSLSERRARSVANYIQSRGVTPQRILVSGLGPDQPVASNTTNSGRQQNRRVAIQLEPFQG